MGLLKEAETKASSKEAKKEYKKIIEYIKSIKGPQYYLPSLRIQSQVEYARLITIPQNRERYWNKTLKRIISSLNGHSNNENLIETCLDSIIAYIQDEYIEKDFNLLKKVLNIALGKLNKRISQKQIEDCHSLLVKKATVLRNTSSYEITPFQKKRRAQDALTCIEKALSINDSWYGYLELGNSFWQLSKFATKEKEYNSFLEKAEEAYWNSYNFEPNSRNSFTLCLFYKHTYQTSPFISTFSLYEKYEQSKIRFLENSIYLAEIATSIFYSGYPQEIMDEVIKKSISLLELAIDYGIADARKIVNLVFLKACIGELSVSEQILSTLKIQDSFAWNNLIKNLESLKKADDLFSKGFIMGIDDPSIWNKLGTFAIDFLGDFQLSRKLYDVSLMHRPSNPIVLTNIARLLVLESPDDLEKLKEAKKLISKAASQSNFRFQWWRGVREQIDQLLGEETAKKRVIPMTKKLNKKLTYKNKREVVKSFIALEKIQDITEKEINFENIISSLISSSISNKYSKYLYENQQEFKREKIFFFEKDFYKFRVTWKNSPTKLEDIIPFLSSLKNSPFSGLFISGSGFDPLVIEFLEAIKNQSTLVLMNKDEVELALLGQVPFDEMIRIKQIFLYKDNNPYYIIHNRTKKVYYGNMG